MNKEKAVAHGPRSFLWSEQEYEPRDLMEKFEHLLPFVAMVTQGYCGKDESIHMFASDEIYWLREIAYQKRVVCRDNNKEYYSIPLYYPEDVTPSQSNGVDGPMMSIKEMMNKCIYRFFKFEPGSCHSITKNGDNYQYKDLGTLEITETYDERFLIVHTVLSGAYRQAPSRTNPRGYNNVDGIFSKFTIIPLYMPIALAVAVGMSDSETENFHRTMYNFEKFVDKQPGQYDEFLKEVSDIMAFDEAPSGGDYEYIHFLQFIRANKDKQNISSDGYWSISDVPMSSPKPELPQRGNKVTTTKSGPAPKRPRKPGEHKKSLKATLQALPRKVKNKASRETTVSKPLGNHKERAPSPVSESDDSLDYEEIPKEPKIPPNHPSITFIPTPLAHREGTVALGVEVGPVIEELNDMLLSGITPKSTKVETPPPPKKEICKPKVLPRAPIAHEIIEHEQVDMSRHEPPPIPERGIDRSKSTPSEDNGDHVKASFQHGRSQSLDVPDISKQVTVRKLMPNTQSISIDMSDILSSKLNLKSALSTKPATGRTDTPSPQGVMQRTNPVLNKDSRNLATGGPEKPMVIKKPQAKLPMPPRTEPHIRIQGNRTLEDGSGQVSLEQDELRSILKKRAELIQAKPLTENSYMAIVEDAPKPAVLDKQPRPMNKRETAVKTFVEPSAATKKLDESKDNIRLKIEKESGIESGSNNTRDTEKTAANTSNIKQSHGSNIAVIQPQVKAKPNSSVKPIKPNVAGKPIQEVLKNAPDDVTDVKKTKYVLKVLSDDIVSGADIPQDVSKFTVGDIARCLELLNMSKYVNAFVANQVDGALLQSLDETILQAEFGINGILAKKLMMFTNEGWRPNV